MKKVLLTSLLVLVMVFAFAMTNDNIKSVTRAPFDANPMAAKDSMAIAAGAVGILELGGDMRGFAPTPLTSMTYDPANDLLQIVTGHYNSGAGAFDGVYNTYSSDNGANWAAPALISDAGAWVRNYNSIAAAPADNYPYVVLVNRSASMMGNWFTTDALGPGGGGWTANMLISDTVNGAGYMPTLAVNNDGSKVAYLTYDAALGFGINNSSDYGSSWGTYGVPAVFDPYDLASGVWWVDVSKLVWGSGDNVYAVLGMVHNDDTIRSDIAGSGPGSAIGHGLSLSADAGATYSAVAMAFGAGNSMPPYASMNGDTMTVYIDTTDNATADTVVVHAFLDPATGLWTDDLDGSIGNGNGFGSWWYWWDAEMVGDIVYAAIPYADLFIDYYADADGDFHTFPWQGQSIMFGKMDLGNSETNFTWIRKDIHDDNILSPAGDTPTWLGNAYSANIAGLPNGDCYVVFNDYYDTAVGVTSIMYMYYDESANTLSDPMIGVLNAGAYEVETAAMAEMIDDTTAVIHCAFVSNSQDSIYYITFQADIALGIEDIETAPAAAFNVPSLVRDNGELSFTLSASGRVEIALYDVTGREIRSLANSTFTKGSHTVNFSADDLSTGVYFAKIKSDNLNASKKVIVVR